MASGFKLLKSIKRPHRRNQFRYVCAAHLYQMCLNGADAS